MKPETETVAQTPGETASKSGEKTKAESATEGIQEQDDPPSVQMRIDNLTRPQGLNDRQNVKERSADNGKTPKIHSFTPSHSQINRGQNSSLSWSVSNADRVRIEPGVGKVGILGSRVIYPSETTKYTIIAINESGEARWTQQIEVVNKENKIIARKTRR
jgi:hypothetical protein